MGMFDDYLHEVECPYCGRTLPSFQGKDGPCTLTRFELGDAVWIAEGLFEVHEICGRTSRANDDWHWVEGVGVVHEGRWIATVITSVSAMESGKERLWDIRKGK